MGGSGPARTYPKADTKSQWWETAFARGTFTGIEKILLHTTETTGWPGYASGSMAPTLTYHPRLRAWRQHNYLDTSARALVDPTSTPVRENRDNVIQIEIIAYSDEATGRRVGGLPVTELTDVHLGDLADFIKFVRAEYGGPPLVAAKFLPYPSSYGNSAVRMTSAEYDAFKGILGHQHASGNDHGDPGALNVARILQLVAPTPAAPQEADMQLTDVIPGTNPPITVAQALARGARAYDYVISGGPIEKRLSNVEAAVATVPAQVDKRLKDSAVKVDVAVQYPQPPAPPAA